MVSNEWALIIYTLLIQTAVGAYIMSYVINTKVKNRIGEEKSFKLYMQTQYLVGLLAVAGLAVSLFHLGTPWKAANSIFNLASSWLSREIILTAGFVILWALAVVLARRTQKIPGILVLINAVVGLLAIFAMGKIYSTTLIPAWQGLHTFAAFYTTSFILGTLLAIGITGYMMNKQKLTQQRELYTSVLTPVSYIILIAVAVQVVIVPNYLVSLVTQGGAGQATAYLLSEEYGFILALRWFLTILGGMALIIAAWRQYAIADMLVIQRAGHSETAAASDAGPVQAASAAFIYLAFVVMAAGEMIGRYLFYASGVQIMLGLM
jgi:anaerobic dimethyl sulfoxide reductase subunit C (anchor subunit)